MDNFSYIENQIKSNIKNNEKIMKILEESIDSDINTIKNVYAMCELQKANNDSLKILKDLYFDIKKLENSKGDALETNSGADMKSIMALINGEKNISA